MEDRGRGDLESELGFATVSSDTSYSSRTQDYTFDATGLLESLGQYYGNYPRILSPVYETTRDKSFTEELRLVSKDSGPWDWVAGAYFNHRIQDLSEYETLEGFATWSEIPGSGMPPGCTVENPITCPYPTYGDVIQFYKGGIRPSSNPINPDLNYTLDRSISFRDFALFGEESHHFTDKWQGTAGARVFWQNYQQELTQTLPECGAFCSASGTDPTGLTAVDNAQSFRSQIFKLNTSYTIAPRTLVYLTWSEGFRHGGANALPTGSCYYCEPKSLLTYEPDTARNTELGIKGSFGSGSSYTLTVYHIDWRNPQIEGYTLTGGFQFVTNGVSARSQGAETELTLRIAEPLKLELGYSYTDANLTASFVRGYNDLVGVSGDQLPNVSDNQVTAAVDYSSPVGGGSEFHARIGGSYRSSFWTNLRNTSGAQELGGFTLLSARIGMGFGPQWRIDAFVDNLANKLAATAVSYTPGPDHDRADFVVRPRTAGVEVRYAFKSK
jgi:iron complex outermembrane receptor protein